MTLGIWLLALAGLPPAVVAGRDLALNFRAPTSVDYTQATAHAKARTAAVVFAVAAPPLYAVAPAAAVAFWAFSMLFAFVLVPNRVLAEPTRRTARPESKRPRREQ